MTQASVILSSKVISRIQSLPVEDRTAISNALAGEILLGQDPKGVLSPTLMIAYTFIKHNIDYDSRHRV